MRIEDRIQAQYNQRRAELNRADRKIDQLREAIQRELAALKAGYPEPLVWFALGQETIEARDQARALYRLPGRTHSRLPAIHEAWRRKDLRCRGFFNQVTRIQKRHAHCDAIKQELEQK